MADLMSVLRKAHAQDPIGTEAMIDDVVYDVMADMADEHRSLLNRAHGAFVLHTAGSAKRALGRSYVGSVSKGVIPDDSVQQYAQWLAGIEAYALEVVSKSQETWDVDGRQQRRDVKRDAGGRFARGVSQTARKNPQQAPSERIAAPVRQVMSNNGTPGDREQRMQAQYEEADRIIGEFAAGFRRGERRNINVRMSMLDDTTGQMKTLEVPLSDVADGLGDAPFSGNGQKWNVEDTLTNIEIVPGRDADAALHNRVQDFNTMGSMGGMGLARVAAIPAERRSAFANAMMPRQPEQGVLSRLWGRLGAGGDVLESMGEQKLANVARFAGTMGPEAQRVLEPRFMQAAYRYRGTEKEPDLELVSQFNGRAMAQIDQIAAQGSWPDAAVHIGENDRKEGITAAEGSLRARAQTAMGEGRGMTEDELRLAVRSDAAAAHMISTLPLDSLVPELSRRSGTVLPSQGVLIDADGDVVSQAVGYGEDTYLPFDYGSLQGRLRGGQYVRTRVAGGLTGEDISAAISHGARRSTVVSSSGVFSIEFDPNFRGRRGSDDTARRMYDRYLKILDAVENSGLYTQDIDARAKASISAEAAEITGTDTGPEYKAVYERLEAKARREASKLTNEELDDLQQQAQEQAATAGTSPQNRARLADDIFRELKDKAAEEKASKLRLNAEGYKVALQTLQQQFPYFIRSVEHETLGDFLDRRGQSALAGRLRQRSKTTDLGYVRPGGLKSESTQEGFYEVAEPRQWKNSNRTRDFDQTPEQAQAAQQQAQAAQQQAAQAQAPAAGATISQRANAFRASAQTAATQAISGLSVQWGKVMTPQSLSNNNLPWEQVDQTNHEIVLGWFLNKQAGEMQSIINNPEQLAAVTAAMDDTDVAANMIEQRIAMTTGQSDFWNGGGTIGDATNPRDAAVWMARQLHTITDARSIAEPFSPAQSGSPEYYTGNRPQNIEIAGTPVDALATTKRLNAALKSEPETARAAGILAQGSSSPADMATKAAAQIRAYQAVEKLQAAMKNEQRNAAAAGYPNPTFEAVVGMAGLDLAKVTADLATIGVTPDDAGLKSDAAKDPKKKALTVQKGWAAAHALTVLSRIEQAGQQAPAPPGGAPQAGASPQGGGGAPFGPAGSSPQPPVTKADRRARISKAHPSLVAQVLKQRREMTKSLR